RHLAQTRIASVVDDGAALHGDAHLLAVALLEADTGGLLGLRVDEHHVGRVDPRLLLDDAGLTEPRRALVALHEVPALDEDAITLMVHAEDGARLALVLAGDHRDEIALLDSASHQITSGASETIFMNFLPRSSRATGPKIRVPMGSLSLLMMTALFVSNLMYVPSGRRYSRRVRTTTARATSPFFTRDCGWASCTATTITSPTLA